MVYERKIDNVIIDFENVILKSDFSKDLNFDETSMNEFDKDLSLKKMLDYYILKSRPQKGLEKFMKYISDNGIRCIISADFLYYGAFIYRKLYFDYPEFEIYGNNSNIFIKNIEVKKEKAEKLILTYFEKNRNHRAFENYFFRYPCKVKKNTDLTEITEKIETDGKRPGNFLYISSLESDLHKKVLESKGFVAAFNYDEKLSGYVSDLKKNYKYSFFDSGSKNHKKSLMDLCSLLM